MAEAFFEAGIHVAEATAGRLLRKLDRAGLTIAIRTRGRVITDKGHRRLAELRLAQRQDERSAQLVEATKATEIHELVDLLYVRRAVDGEAARLAAMRATDEDIHRMAAVDSAHVDDWRQIDTRVTSSRTFHRLIATASHNAMLIAVVTILLDDAHEPLARLLDQLTIPSNDGSRSSFALEHHATLEAIRNRDPDVAESTMRAHIDHLIREVQGPLPPHLLAKIFSIRGGEIELRNADR
jgi:DNA-binding FadR family transcriptional regulator